MPPDCWKILQSVCGIDVSKDRLDIVVLAEQQCFSVRNDAAGCWSSGCAASRIERGDHLAHDGHDHNLRQLACGRVQVHWPGAPWQLTVS
jgi:hypothetical protein